MGDGSAISSEGFLQGYDVRTVSVILMNALGGLLCAVMLKYAGATHGCLATAMSLILTCLASMILLGDFVPDILFVVGTVLAIAASLTFAMGLPEWLTKLCAPE